MSSSKFISKIRNYSIISFLLPLIAINVCLVVYKLLGDMDRHSKIYLNEKEYEYSIDDYHDIENSLKSKTFTNCSKYKSQLHFITIDNEVITEEDLLLRKSEHEHSYITTLIQQIQAIIQFIGSPPFSFLSKTIPISINLII